VLVLVLVLVPCVLCPVSCVLCPACVVVEGLSLLNNSASFLLSLIPLARALSTRLPCALPILPQSPSIEKTLFVYRNPQPSPPTRRRSFRSLNRGPSILPTSTFAASSFPARVIHQIVLPARDAGQPNAALPQSNSASSGSRPALSYLVLGAIAPCGRAKNALCAFQDFVRRFRGIAVDFLLRFRVLWPPIDSLIGVQTTARSRPGQPAVYNIVVSEAQLDSTGLPAERAIGLCPYICLCLTFGSILWC
jgi:hypothetical protein